MKYIRNYTDLQHLVNSIIPIIPYIELTLRVSAQGVYFR